MIPSRSSLPHPPARESAGRVAVFGLTPNQIVERCSKQIDELTQQVDTLTVQVLETVCGGADESQHVELYDGTLGVSRSFVDRFEKPIGQLKWRDDLANLFGGAGDSIGNVAGVRWSSGGLVSRDLLLTAGHSFDQSGGAWQYPRRQGQALAPPEIARSMEASFGFQVDGTSANSQLRPDERFPVVELVEHRVGGLDYAVARLGADANGRLPGDRFGWLAIAPEDVMLAGTMLCLIQHPNGQPKRIEAGPLRDNRGGRITYDSLDTLGGSSGSPILSSPDGHVVGIHTNGGCTHFAGFNSGLASGVIRRASSVLTGLPIPPTDGHGAVVGLPVVTTVPATLSDMSLADRLARFDRIFGAISAALSMPPSS